MACTQHSTRTERLAGMKFTMPQASSHFSGLSSPAGSFVYTSSSPRLAIPEPSLPSTLSDGEEAPFDDYVSELSSMTSVSELIETTKSLSLTQTKPASCAPQCEEQSLLGSFEGIGSQFGSLDQTTSLPSLESEWLPGSSHTEVASSCLFLDTMLERALPGSHYSPSLESIKDLEEIFAV